MTSTATAGKLLQARELMDVRFCESLNVATVAGSVGLSSAHFIREFHELFGETPHQYLIGLRMRRAALLLCTTNRPVSDICRAIGWRSVGSFTTRFTRTYGVSPTAFRLSRATAHATDQSASGSEARRPALRGS